MQSKDWPKLLFLIYSAFTPIPPASSKLDCDFWVHSTVAIYNPILKLESFSNLAWPQGQEQSYGDKYLHILKQGPTRGHAKIL